jgi:hypothetical protein
MPKSIKGKAKPRAYTGDLADPIYEPILGAFIANDLARMMKGRAANRRAKAVAVSLTRQSAVASL